AEGSMILDAGCGTGGNLKWLGHLSGSEKIIGIEMSKDALMFCREHGRQNLAQASTIHLPFADNTFDLVTSFDVLVQLPGETSDEHALGEIYRVLRPGGIGFLRVAAYRWMLSSHDRALATQRRYSLRELVGKAERAGFTTLRATYANSLLLPLAAIRRLL